MIRVFVLLFSLFLFSINSFATSLFDSKRGVVDMVKPTVKPKAPVAVKNTRIDYKLVAISKLGKRHNLTFKNIRKNDRFQTSWVNGEKANESPLKGYYIASVENRGVIFKANNDAAFRCQESKTENVSCDSNKKTIRYGLVTNKPVRTITPKKSNIVKNKQPSNKTVKKNDPKKNYFQPKRISPDEVPENMRLVKTPFGDRLVPK